MAGSATIRALTRDLHRIEAAERRAAPHAADLDAADRRWAELLVDLARGTCDAHAAERRAAEIWRAVGAAGREIVELHARARKMTPQAFDEALEERAAGALDDPAADDRERHHLAALVNVDPAEIDAGLASFAALPELAHRAVFDAYDRARRPSR